MDHLMLLGGQFLRAQIRNECRPDRNLAAARSREFWGDLEAIEHGVVDAFGLATRIVVGLVVLGAIFAALSLAALQADELPATACLACSAAVD